MEMRAALCLALLLSACTLPPATPTFPAVTREAVVVATAGPTQAMPRVFLVNPQTLAQVKAAIQVGNPRYEAPLAKLKSEAEAMLTAGPFSVVNKSLAPPSGDKHDYLSLAPYYWPNPESKDGLPYVFKEGQANPESESVADYKNLQAMSSAVSTLALAYYFTDDPRYADRAALLLRIWFIAPETRMNPNLNFGQAIPGKTSGRGIGILETRSFADVIDAAGLIETSPAWQAADQQALQAWFSSYLDWLTISDLGKSEAGEKNHHGVWYDTQRAAMALFTGKHDLAKSIVSDSIGLRLGKQIEPDGRQPVELGQAAPWHNSVFNLQAWFRLASLGEQVGVDLFRYETMDGRSLRKALDYLRRNSEGTPWPSPATSNDVEGSATEDQATLFAIYRQAAVIYQAPAYTQLALKLPGIDPASQRINLLLPPGGGQ